MFAFAIWDRERRQLFLARDRYGVKPLYWHWNRGLFIFASEIKAMLEHPRVPRELCYPALNEYFTFQNVFSDLTLFHGIRLLPPGCTLKVNVHGGSLPDIRRYWDYSTTEGPANVSEDESAEAVHHLFEQAVTRQLVSDVPVGTYLSGGMDSSSITAVAASHLPRLHTFTAGFDLTSASGLELGFDERHAAETVSNELKTQHYEVVMHAGDMEWVLPKLIWHLEDLRVGQCYPNYYAAGLAGKFVKVVLSGAGGDELFGGYPWRYFRGLDCDGREDYYGRYYDFWQRLVPDDDKLRLFNAETKRRIADHSTFDVFRGVFADWPGAFRSTEDYVNASLYFELRTFLHGLLVVEDKLSMAHSLETRVPFLDNDLVDLALRTPARFKLRNLDRLVPMDENDVGKRLLYGLATNDGKAVLRKAMRGLIPRSVAERGKQGFSAPDASWFRGESIDYLNGLLRDPRARIYEFLRPEYVSFVLDEHSSGRVNHRLLIWSLLNFEWWCRIYLFADVDADLIGRPSDEQLAQARQHP
jgi:asparagine synthase (glutamine-hydrolysing)